MLRLLFEIMLNEMMTMGLHGRIEEEWPKTSTDAQRFHVKHSKLFFGSFCNGRWENSSPEERDKALNRFLFCKFSTDPRGRMMCPPPDMKPAKASVGWGKVWLELEERRSLVERIVARYQMEEASMLARTPGFNW